MGDYDFTYTIPNDFSSRAFQIIEQLSFSEQLGEAFGNCFYDYDELGYSYYVGIRGDNWNKKAIDLTFTGDKQSIDLLRNIGGTIRTAVGRALQSNTSGLQLHQIFYLQSNPLQSRLSTDDQRYRTALSKAKVFLNDLFLVGEKLGANSAYTQQSPEDSITDYLRDILSFKGYEGIKDQSRHGLSATSKSAGEVDLLVTKSNDEIALIECLKLNSVDSTIFFKHIHKAVHSYNPLGTPVVIVSYVSTVDFSAFWLRYYDYLKSCDFGCPIVEDLRDCGAPNAASRLCCLTLSKDEFKLPVFFLSLQLINK